MNRIARLVYTRAIINCPKTSRGFLVLPNGNVDVRPRVQYLGRRSLENAQFRRFSSSVSEKDIREIEHEGEKTIGWFLKVFFFGTAGVVAYHLFPYMGENLMQQSVALLRVKDPLFKRMGASRLARFAIDDKKRMKIVELGGMKELLTVLEGAKDDRTRKAALKALAAVSKSDGAVAALHEAGAIPIIRSTPDSNEHLEIQKYKMTLMNRFQDLKYDISS